MERMINLQELCSAGTIFGWRVVGAEILYRSYYSGGTELSLHLERRQFDSNHVHVTFSINNNGVPVLSDATYTRTAKLLLQIDPSSTSVTETYLIEEFKRQIGDAEYPQPQEPKALKKVSGAYRLWRLWRHKNGQLYPLVRSVPWAINPQGFIECDEIPKISDNDAYWAQVNTWFNNTQATGFYGFLNYQSLVEQEGPKMTFMNTGAKAKTERIRIVPTTGMVHTTDVPAGDEYTYVVGTYLGWGKVVSATLGCRVQYAKPEHLLLPNDNEDYSIELMTLADKYGMKPIVLEDALKLETGLVPWEMP